MNWLLMNFGKFFTWIFLFVGLKRIQLLIVMRLYKKVLNAYAALDVLSLVYKSIGNPMILWTKSEMKVSKLEQLIASSMTV